MHVFRRAEPQRPDVVLLQQVEDLQRRDALGVGGQGVDVVSAVAGGHRPDPFGSVRGQVRLVQVAAVLPHVGGNLPGDLAAVEGLPAVRRERFVGLCEARIGEDLAFRRRISAGHVAVGEPRKLVQGTCVAGPGGRRQLAYRKPFAGQFDGRRQQVAEVQGAVSSVQLEPAVHGSGGRDRQRTEGRDRIQREIAEHVQVQRAWSAAAGVQAHGRVLVRLPDHREQVAADAAAGRFGQPQHGVRGDRRIDGVAAGS